MKLIIITFLILSAALINCKSKNSKNEKLTVEAKNKNKQIPMNPDSITYGYATNDDAVLQNAADFRTAQIMPRIPIHLNHPFTGIMAEATGVIKNR